MTKFGSKYTFMPDATRGSVRFLNTEQLLETGTNTIVVNTLHLLISPGPEKIQRLGGIKKFMNFPGTVLSDSGGFQVFSLLHSKKWDGKITKDGAVFRSPKNGDTFELTPERSIEIQMMLDTDVMVALDDCRKADISRKEAEISVERTIEWARRAKTHFDKLQGTKKGKLLACVVQGANFLDLREKCAKELSKLNLDGYNFGGYVINEKGKLVVEEMGVVLENTPKDSFKYAMGVGKPKDIIKTAKIGYTIFDTVLPSRNARHATLYTDENRSGVMHIKNARYSEDIRPIEKGCDCHACQNYTRAYIHHMLRVEEAVGMQLATIHNLRYFQRLMERLNRK